MRSNLKSNISYANFTTHRVISKRHYLHLITKLEKETNSEINPYYDFFLNCYLLALNCNPLILTISQTRNYFPNLQKK